MNIGWSEFLVLGMIGLIVFGPERLPEMSAQFARFIKNLRAKASSATAELTNSVDSKVVTDLAKDLRGLTPRGMATNVMTANVMTTPTKRSSSSPSKQVNPVFDPDAT